MTTLASIFLVALCLVLCGCGPSNSGQSAKAMDAADEADIVPGKLAAQHERELLRPASEPSPTDRVSHTDADWCELLTPAQYAILRGGRTEQPFQNALWDNHRPGMYRCAACGLMLFNSQTKFESGTGWPSFYQPVAANTVKLVEDDSFGMKRIEVLCARCGSHLGHVFDDGPAPTGKRFCINSGALEFIPADTGDVTTKPTAK